MESTNDHIKHARVFFWPEKGFLSGLWSGFIITSPFPLGNLESHTTTEISAVAQKDKADTIFDCNLIISSNSYMHRVASKVMPYVRNAS